MNAEKTIQALLLAHKTHKVVTLYADGSRREHETSSLAQAENFAVGERRKIGRPLISRATGLDVIVSGVTIEVI